MRKRKSLVLLLLAVCLLLSGCDIAWFSSTINELKGSLIGNSYTIGTYDNYGNKTLETSGKKISITGNKIETISYDSNGKAIRGYDLSSVITITIDGKEIESCGDTCIFMQNGLNPEVDFSTEVIESNGGNGVTDNTAVARYLNKYKNYFGKSRIVVIKSQLGQPIVAFSGDDVYWEIPRGSAENDKAHDRRQSSLYPQSQLPDHRQKPFKIKKKPCRVKILQSKTGKRKNYEEEIL